MLPYASFHILNDWIIIISSIHIIECYVSLDSHPGQHSNNIIRSFAARNNVGIQQSIAAYYKIQAQSSSRPSATSTQRHQAPTQHTHTRARARARTHACTHARIFYISSKIWLNIKYHRPLRKQKKSQWDYIKHYVEHLGRTQSREPNALTLMELSI